jgi:citrate lyase beta subunit
VQELEDFTPPALRPRARALANALYVRWRATGAVVAVRVNPLEAINRVFAPQPAEIARARRIVAAFEKARAAGRERATVDGALIEVPIYAAAKRLLESLVE